MGIAFVQAVAGAFAPNGTNTLSYTSNNTLGNFLFCSIIQLGTTGQTFSVSDSQGNTWNPVGSPISGPLRTTQIFYAMNCKVGANAVKPLSTDTTDAAEIFLGEYSGVATTSALDQHTNSSAAGSVGDAISSGNVSTGAANELLIGVMFNNTGTTIAAAGDTPNMRENPNTVHAYADGISGAIGLYAAQFSINNISALWMCALATFKAQAPSGGPGTGLPPFGWVNTQGDHYNKRGLR